MVTYSVLAWILAMSQVTSVIYHVNPDAGNATNTITYYQEHGKLFSSNIQLYFQPGLFYIRKPLIINKVANYSFIGSSNGETVIICETSQDRFLINNSVNIEIKNIIIKCCDYGFKVQSKSGVVVSNLMIVMTEKLLIENSSFLAKFYNGFGLSMHDPIGVSSLLRVNSSSLFIHMHNVTMNTNIRIVQFHHFQFIQPTNKYIISFVIHDHSREVDISLSQTKICQQAAVAINIIACASANTIAIDNLQLISKDWSKNHLPKISDVIELTFGVSCTAVTSNNNSVTYVQFNNCRFTNINKDTRLISIKAQQITNILYPIIIHIKNSNFYNISKTNIIFSGRTDLTKNKPLVTLILTNSTFKHIYSSYLINMIDTRMIIQGPVYFCTINSTSSVLIKVSKDIIKIENHAEFSFTNSNVLISTNYIVLETNTIINFTSNKFKVGILFPKNKDALLYLVCAFQYVNSMNNHIIVNETYKSSNFSVLFKNNSGNMLFFKRYSTSHCDWIEQSVFLRSDPQEINNQLIGYSNNSFKDSLISNQICICTNAQDYNCTADELQPAYPGQQYSLGLIAKNVSSSIVDVRIDELPFTSCRTQTELMRINIFQNNCTTINFTIKFGNRMSCELYLRGKSSSSFIAINGFNTLQMESNQQILNVYHISMFSCPIGFILNALEGFCQCHPLLQGNIIFITDCNINDQTILRPANSWISAHTVNNSYTYDVSLECPFDYCMPHQSYINLATPNLQCQFNRYGVLCGHCPPGHSAVFGSSQCKHCSNVYLLIIIPIAIAGIVLVFLLFILNLTVTDGSITPFIYYANIISISGAVFFPKHHSLFSNFTYAFVSIANLDLGIETCFYHGMTGYAKIYLQLVFPFYLISIAILLIVASRYSTRIQRLTARRALPVLATLFTLSYTKILQTVCMALFFYSSFNRLPGKHNMVMWSVDTSIKIFEIKFIFLFILCLSLFLILMMFNLVLIFSRPLSRFKVINNFKPVLDACHGPFKDRFYYWTGLQLATRAIYFGISALDQSIHLVVATMLLCIITSVHGYLHPFKTKDKAIPEIFFLLNLQGLFLTRMYTATNTIPVNILITIAAVQFGLIIANQIKVHVLPRKVQHLIDTSPCCSILYRQLYKPIRNVKLNNQAAERDESDDGNEFWEPLLAD